MSDRQRIGGEIVSLSANNREHPVSIIVPVYNDASRVADLMESLLEQDYPQSMYEIIVIDNRSTDKTKETVRKYDPVILLEENSIQSSYAARNKGIKSAKNEILAFIDSDCIANPHWLREGVQALLDQEAHLVGGKVEFYFSDQKTAAECYDSLIHFRFDETIQERHLTGTGNLFVRSFVFKKIGLFPHVKSGGDFQWTAKAVREGYRLVYCPGAIVCHPARKLIPLLKKHFRTGSGKPFIWQSREGTFFKPSLVLSLFPPNIFKLKNLVDRRGTKDMRKMIFGLWVVKYLCKLAFFTGAMVSVVSLLCRPGNISLFTTEAAK